jgi:chromosome segregation protein
MKLDFVEISGFRGFKNKTTFQFPSGFAVLTGRNGAGKSSVFDAVDFALTGTINKYQVTEARGGGLNDHIWWVGDGKPDAQYVLIGFSDTHGNRFQVRRSRDKGLEAPESQIASLLCQPELNIPLWPQTLMQTTLIRDEMIAALSLDLTEQQRFSAVQAAMGGLRGTDHSERTKSILRAAEAALAAQKKKVDSAQGELGRALGSLTEARSLAANSSELREVQRLIASVIGKEIVLNQDGLASVRSMILDRRRSIDSLHRMSSELDEIQTTLNYFTSGEGAKEIEGQTLATQAAQRELDSSVLGLQTAMAQYEVQRDQDAMSLHLAGLLEHGESVGLIDGHCPLCDAPRTDKEFLDALSRLKERTAENGARAQSISEQLDRSRQREAAADRGFRLANEAYETLLRRRDDAQRRSEAIKDELSQLPVKIAASSATEVRDGMLRIQEETSSLEQAVIMAEGSSAVDRVASFENRVNQLRETADSETIKLGNIAQAVDLAKQIDKATKVVSNELLSEQFETVLPLLKELYLRLRPHAEWQEIETEIGGHIRASLNFTVGDGRNPQFLFSSGQRRTAGIAFLLAIHLSRPWCKFDTLLLDDPVQHIDDYRALNLAEVLSAIRRDGRQVIIAVEDVALADLLCRRLRSVLGDEGKRFELGMESDGSATIIMETQVSPLPKEVMQMSQAS